MVTAAHPLTVVSELDFRVEILKGRRASFPRRSSSGQEVSSLECLETVTANEVIQQLFHMTLASLRGYQEISKLVSEEPLRTFLDVLVRQRTARCQALTQLLPQTIRLPLDFNPDEESLVDPTAFDLRIMWLRTIWSIEKEEFARFGDYIDMAELLLEDACLAAADTFRTSSLAALFRDHAIDVCGARQRLEVLAGDLAMAAWDSTQ